MNSLNIFSKAATSAQTLGMVGNTSDNCKVSGGQSTMHGTPHMTTSASLPNNSSTHAPSDANSVAAAAAAAATIGMPHLDITEFYQLGNINALGISPHSSQNITDFAKNPLQEGGSQNGGVEQLRQLSRDWVQSFITHVPSTVPQFTSMAHHHHQQQQQQQMAGSTTLFTPNVESSCAQTAAAASSDSDSDDISKSLSFLLTQQLSQHNSSMSSPQPAHSAPGDIKRPQSTSATLSQGESYSTSLSNFLEIGYDDGRRVINMPNPLESLSLDIPINPPVQPMVGVDLLGGQRLSKDAMMYVTMGHQQNAFVAMSENPVLHPNDTANILGFHSSNLCALPQASVAGSVDHTKVEQHLRIGDASQLASLGIASTRNARRVVSKALGGAQDVRLLPTDTAQRPKSRRGRPPLAGGSKRSASANVGKAHLRMGSSGSETALSTRLQAAATSAMAVGGGSCVQSPCFDNGSAQSSLCHTPSLTATSSALLPHRVDRQLAVAARPLLFVRPREENEPLRRRKRRCVSSNEAATSGNSGANRSASSELGSAQPVSASELSGSGAVAMLGEDGQNNLQWQRISEQRRRDAMRENFDLLKRMLPQAYMASDDGRELARPVLLARFLRWVDDTLIEMEGLKTEVARLKLDNNKNTGPDSVSES